jgi:putative membrane protein
MFNHGHSFFNRGFMGLGSSSIMSTGGIIMMVFFVVLIGLVIYFAVTRNRPHGYHGYQGYQDVNPSENPVNIVKNRYAKGEITKDELDEMLKRLK